MADSRTFRLMNGVTYEGIGEYVEGFLRGKNMSVEGVCSAEGYFVQAKENSDGWKKLAGMDTALQVQITPAGENVIVQIGNGKWSDKVGAGAVGMVLFAPLAVTAGIGAFMQNKLPKEVFDAVEKYILSGGVSVVVGGFGQSKKLKDNEVQCPTCNAVNEKGTKFCQKCGGKMTNTCPKCNTEVAIGIKFCSNCGSNVEEAIKESETEACPKCESSIPAGTKFCNECGANVTEEKTKASGVDCPSCNSSMPEGTKFCNECGAKMDGKKTCPKCGETVDDGVKFCNECGTKVDGGAEN